MGWSMIIKTSVTYFPYFRPLRYKDGHNPHGTKEILPKTETETTAGQCTDDNLNFYNFLNILYVCCPMDSLPGNANTCCRVLRIGTWLINSAAMSGHMNTTTSVVRHTKCQDYALSSYPLLLNLVYP